MIDLDLIQRVVLALTLGLVLTAIGHTIDSWQFWCVIALLLCSNWIHYQQGVEQGVVTTMDMVADLTDERRAELMDMIRKVREED